MLTVKTTTRAKRMTMSSKEDSRWLSRRMRTMILLSDLIVKKQTSLEAALISAAQISLSIS